MLSPFRSAAPLLQELEEAGYEAYFVGGSIRDYLLGRPISDVDIATSAEPQEVKKVFSNTVDVGIQHGTILVHYKGHSYEVTTFRAETAYSDFRRPDRVLFIRSLAEDLQRRDFTMNAIAMDRTGRLIDPFGGRQAIEERTIQTVGKANERFREDALRMLRALRFASQLSFRIEGETLEALTNLVPLLEHIAVERKTAEFEKLLSGPSRRLALQLLYETKVHKYMPGLDVGKEALQQMSMQPCEGLSNMEMWMLLLYYLGLDSSQAESFLRLWKLPSKKIKKLLHRLQWLKYRMKEEWTPAALYMSGRETIEEAERVASLLNVEEPPERVDWLEIYDALPIKKRSDLKVTGKDLMGFLNKQGGPWVSGLLGDIEQAVVGRELANNWQDIREWVKKCNPNSEES